MHLNVVTTLRCNLRCPHCIYGCPWEADLAMEDFCPTVEGLVEHGLASVTFTGGEPILHPGLSTMVDFVARLGLGFGFVSNAWAPDGYMAFVSRHPKRFTDMAVSLDGMEPTHDRARGEGSFQRVVEAVRRYSDLGVPTTVNFLVTDANRGELEPLVALCASLGARTVKVAGFLPTVPAPGFSLSPSAREEIYQQAAPLSDRYGITVNVANSVYHPVAVEFCPVLTHQVLSLEVSGALAFCCDMPGKGGNLGAPGESVQAALARRKRTIDEMTLSRILKARDGALTPEDQSCLYCLRYFWALA